jgi:hypothetical protein
MVPRQRETLAARDLNFLDLLSRLLFFNVAIIIIDECQQW